MTDFIGFEGSVENNNKNEEKDDEVSDSDLDSLKSFIDDNDEIENDRILYQKCENVTTSIDDVLKEEHDECIVDIQKIDASDFCQTSEGEIEIDEFKDTEKRMEKFKETLFPVSMENDDDENNYNYFINAIFFATQFNVEQKNDLCSSAELKQLVDKNLFIQLNQEKFNIILDYQKFYNQCHEVKMLLAKHWYFLIVFELKNKFCHLVLKNPKIQNIVRQLSSSIKEE